MRNRRRLIAIATGLMTVTVTGAAATTLGGVKVGALGAGQAAVSGCDTDGLTVAYTVAAGKVTHATISGIADPACEGQQLQITVANASGASVGSSTATAVPTDGDGIDNSTTVAISPQPAAEVVANFHVSIVQL